MKGYDTIETVVRERACTLWLSREQKRNAINRQMVRELRTCLSLLASDDGVRVLVLRGKGKDFCAGADLSWMRSSADLDASEQPGRLLAGLYQAFYEFPKPIIAVAQGHVMGGALGLTACADFVFAVPTAFFSFSEVRLGVVPATISPFVIRRIGEFRARQLMLSGRVINAEEAMTAGIADRIVSGENMESAVAEWSEQLALNAPAAMKECKKLIREVSGSPLDQKLFEHTTNVLTNVLGGTEAREGLKAFMEKKEPSWNKK